MALKNFDNSLEKVGLFGGRFDPVHRAHVQMARLAADQIGLSSVRWIPAGNPLHKDVSASPQHRLSMLKIALNNCGDNRMIIDERELNNNLLLPSFTYKTIESLKEEFPKKIFFWILGEDQLLNFKNWKNWRWLLDNLVLAFFQRPKENEIIKDGRCASNEMVKILQGYGGEIIPINSFSDKVSSSYIRNSLKKKQSPRDTLDYEVYLYAKEHNLYID